MGPSAASKGVETTVLVLKTSRIPCTSHQLASPTQLCISCPYLFKRQIVSLDLYEAHEKASDHRHRAQLGPSAQAATACGLSLFVPAGYRCCRMLSSFRALPQEWRVQTVAKVPGCTRQRPRRHTFPSRCRCVDASFCPATATAAARLQASFFHGLTFCISAASSTSIDRRSSDSHHIKSMSLTHTSSFHP